MKPDVREIRHYHLFGASGGGAKGFNKGSARVGNMVARFRCIGSIDVDAAACRDFDAHVGAAGAKVENLGDVRWLATEDGSEGKGTGRHIACFILDIDTKDSK